MGFQKSVIQPLVSPLLLRLPRLRLSVCPTRDYRRRRLANSDFEISLLRSVGEDEKEERASRAGREGGRDGARPPLAAVEVKMRRTVRRRAHLSERKEGRKESV